MKTITDTIAISAAFDKFDADQDGAFATCRLVEGASSAFDPQEWAEHGEIDGTPAKVYYLFDEDEATSEDAESYPWDADHITHIEISEKDADGNFEQL